MYTALLTPVACWGRCCWVCVPPRLAKVAAGCCAGLRQLAGELAALQEVGRARARGGRARAGKAGQDKTGQHRTT
jgi:hypothetical protein